jgi:hypothetical protein
MDSVCSSPPSPLSPFSNSAHCCLLWQTGQLRNRRLNDEAYAAYILPQLHNILAYSNPRPFAGNLEGYGEAASEDDVMGGGSSITLPKRILINISPPTHCIPITLNHNTPKRFTSPP